MTTAALDPGAAISEAIRELVDAVRQLVEPDTEDSSVLDELGRLVGRARRKVNKAKKTAEPPVAEPKPAAPAPAPSVAAVPTPAPAVVPPMVAPAATPARSVTRAILPATPERHQSPTPSPGVPVSTAATPRSPVWRLAIIILIAFAVAIVLLLAACSGTPTPSAAAPAAATSSSTAIDPSVQVECSNIQRAYNAWKWTPSSSRDFTDFNVRRLMDKGKDFYKSVEGYQDKSATSLALEIARYNVDVAMVNAAFAASGEVDGSVTSRVVEGVNKINGAFASFRHDTCRVA